MKILLAGPGTGKTTKVKEIINKDYKNSVVQVISFTNATIDDLTASFKDYKNVDCSTLHSYALKLNHLDKAQILNEEEIEILEKLSEKIKVSFDALCDLFGCITFDNMIKSCNIFIKNNPVYASEKIGQLDLLIVDEFQDFNPDEQKLIHIISNYAKETIILGDDDQSIYSFKDADPDGIISLYNDKKIEKIPHENKCYRCPDVVVEACMKLIVNNLKRVPKIWQKSNKHGILEIIQTKNQSETNETVLDKIKDIRNRDKKGSILILSPVGFAAKPLIPHLLNNGFKTNDCWNRKVDIEDQKFIWLLRGIYSEKPNLNLIFYAQSEKQFSKPKFIAGLKTHIDKNVQSKEFKEFLISNINLDEDWKKFLNEPPELNIIKTKSEEFKRILDFIDPEDIAGSLNIIFQLINPKIDFKKGEINLMSIHKSKGLQAEYVFILGLVSGILPNETYGLDTIEAQRRLLFVGMSRALKELFIVSNIYWKAEYVHKVDSKQFKYAHWIKGDVKKYTGQISSFINEINK